MKKTSFALILIYTLFTSCVSRKEYAALEARNKETQDLLNSSTQNLNKILYEKENILLENQRLLIENESLKKTNEELKNRVENSTSSPIEQLIEFCCSNHNPSHCATNMQEMKKLCSEYKCIFK